MTWNVGMAYFCTKKWMPMPAIGTSSHKASTNPKQACKMATTIKFRSATSAGVHPSDRCGGFGGDHSDRALAVLDLRLEPLQVRDATADMGNVPPSAAELRDED